MDIAILDVTPIWTDDQQYDGSLDMRVVQPGDEIEVEVLIMNRGTIEASHETLLIGYVRDGDRALVDSVEIAPLDVGERATYTLSFDVAAGPRWLRWPGFPSDLDSIGEFRLVHEGYEDADSANDARAGFEFHVAAPLLELRLEDVPDTMLTQTTYGASLVIENHAATPFGGALEVEMCAIYFGADFCEQGTIESFSPVTIGAVAPGGTRTQPISLRIRKDALYWFDEVQHVALAPCVPHAGADADCILPPDFDPLADYPVTVIPNLVVDCEPPELTDGESFPVATGLCEHVIASATYAVASFDAVAGECWRAEFTTSSSGSIVLKDAETLELLPPGSPNCALVQQSGTQLLIVYPSTPGGTPSGTILLERIP